MLLRADKPAKGPGPLLAGMLALALGVGLGLGSGAQAQTPAAEPAAAAAGEGAVQSERFDIERFVVEGNTLLSEAEIEALLRPFTGRGREYGDVQRALEALEVRYREKGFAAVQVTVPEQELGRGLVTLQIIEAAIRRVQIQGNQHFDADNIRRALPALKEGGFPNATALSANVQLANENPARQIDLILKGTDDEGLVDVDVNVADNPPLKINLTLDNTGNDATGHYRAGLGLQHANLFNRDHTASFNYITSPDKPDQVAIYSLGYRIPLYRWGDSIDLILAKSDVDAGTTQTVAGPLAFAGKGDIYGVRYNWLLERKGEYSQRVIFGLDLKAFQNACTVSGTVCPGAAGVDVTVRPISATYLGQWASPGAQTDFSFGIARNLPGAGQGDATAIQNARPGIPGGEVASAKYLIYRGGASHTRAVGGDWQFRAAVQAQYSPDALISGEQFSIAGASAVRGFPERDVARDSGYFANLEAYSPNLAPMIGLANTTLRVLGFYDLGQAYNSALQGEPGKQRQSIASTGIGLRWSVQRNFLLRWDFARVLDEGGSKTRGDPRTQFALYYAF